MNPPNARKTSGFSLIELLIGIAILAIALAVGMPSYGQWLQNTHIRNAAESIQNGMQRARAEAVSRNANVSFALGSGAFWRVTNLADGQVIESRPGGEISTSVTLTAEPATTSTITFNNLGTVVNPNADGTTPITQIDIDSAVLAAADSRELRMTVGVGGVIRMCDPNPGVATSDPRHC